MAEAKKEAQQTLNDVLAAITDTLAKGNDLNIIGFGKFKWRINLLMMALILLMVKL